MSEPSHYWMLIRLDAASDGEGYKGQPLPTAQTFFLSQVDSFAVPRRGNRVDTVDEDVQRQLLSFTGADASEAELCLRCYVSHSILWSCVKRARLFGAGDRFTYRDLLPFVLNDDGQLPLRAYIPFSVELVRSFRLDQNCSLNGWVDLRVKRHPDVNRFLLECGLRLTSDWALLNKANPKFLESSEQEIVAAFHAVYRHDRLQARRKQGHCPDPTDNQLALMVQHLNQRQIAFQTTRQLLSRLRQIADRLRQEEIWVRRGTPLAEPLEIADPTTGEVAMREFPDDRPRLTPEELEHLELQTFCRETLLTGLSDSIRRSIDDRIAALKRSSRRAHLADKFQPALRLLYFEARSQTEIAARLGMTDQYEVSRMLDLKSLLSDVRNRMQEKLLASLLDKAKYLGLVQDPIPPTYLSNLIHQVETTIDEAVFQEAATEIRASKNRAMNSLFAQQLRQLFDDCPAADPLRCTIQQPVLL